VALKDGQRKKVGPFNVCMKQDTDAGADAAITRAIQVNAVIPVPQPSAQPGDRNIRKCAFKLEPDCATKNVR